MSSLCAHQQAVSALYAEHHGWLKALLRKKLGDLHQAADLAHDTFLLLVTTPSTLQQLREPRSYLRTVAHGLVVDHFRRRALEQAYCEALIAMPEPLALSPEDRLLIMEALHRIDAMLDQLPGRARTVFLLSQLDGLGYEAIAKRLDMSVRTVKRDMRAGFAQCLAAML
jgi:RNA polymerase sigma factor (sigma-70 family)